jgi:hypothetical protein
MEFHPDLTAAHVERFAELALACVHREYPNKIAHVLNSDADVLPPRKLTPAFYGCFDWHSSVHGHWLLVRLLRLFPNGNFAARARAALKQNLTAANLAQEATYFNGAGRTSFERPYGLAWLLQLCTELREWNDADAREFSLNLRPLEGAVLRRIKAWLPKLPFPVRSGEHSQTAFAVGLMLDYSRANSLIRFERLIESSVVRFYLNDRNAPLHFEPSGEDFLSPSLAEADAIRRLMSPKAFGDWLAKFLPQIPTDGGTDWLRPAISPDRGDGKLAHLDGLNLSRSWMLEGMASALWPDDPRQTALRSAAAEHAQAGLEAVTGEHYEGGHWLASFAVYLTTRRGIAQ